jgi:hypothetical protein
MEVKLGVYTPTGGLFLWASFRMWYAATDPMSEHELKHECDMNSGKE